MIGRARGPKELMTIARKQCHALNDTAHAETPSGFWFARGQRLGKPILLENAPLGRPIKRIGPRPTIHHSPITFHLSPHPQLRSPLPFDICPK